MEPARGELLSIPQAAAYLGTGERFVRRIVGRRDVAVVKVGKHVRIHRGDLDDYIERNRREAG